MVQKSRHAINSTTLRRLIDDELAALPARYREVLVMCDLEGFSRKEVAERLSLPLGTVSSRLARGRKQLKQRLAREGILLSTSATALLATAHAEAALPANASPLETPVPDEEVFDVSTVADNAAMSLQATAMAEGALHAMAHTHWKTTARLFAFVAASTMTANLPADWQPTINDGTFAALPNQFFDAEV